MWNLHINPRLKNYNWILLLSILYLKKFLCALFLNLLKIHRETTEREIKNERGSRESFKFQVCTCTPVAQTHCDCWIILLGISNLCITSWKHRQLGGFFKFGINCPPDKISGPEKRSLIVPRYSGRRGAHLNANERATCRSIVIRGRTGRGCTSVGIFTMAQGGERACCVSGARARKKMNKESSATGARLRAENRRAANRGADFARRDYYHASKRVGRR